MSVIWNPGGLRLTDDNGVTTILGEITDFVIEPRVSEYVAKSCSIEIELMGPQESMFTTLTSDRHAKVTFELENGETLIVHLKPTPVSQTNPRSMLVLDDLVEQDTEEVPVDLDGLL